MHDVQWRNSVLSQQDEGKGFSALSTQPATPRFIHSQKGFRPSATGNLYRFSRIAAFEMIVHQRGRPHDAFQTVHVYAFIDEHDTD